jgi:hypothetical protein
METPKEYYYTYYSYEEWGRGYFGSRKCYCLPEEDTKYLGSSKDKTFKPKYKIILKDDYDTREEAYADEIILQEYYKVVENPHFANKSYQTSTKFCYIHDFEYMSNFGKTQGKINFENGVGIHALTPEQKSECGKLGGKKSSQKNKELGIGIYAITPEQRIENAKKGGKKGTKMCKELGIGIYGITPEQRVENGKKGGKKMKELGLGVHSMTKEQRSELSKKNNAQKWECCETGYISTAAGVVAYQKGKGVDTSKTNRRKVS